MISEAGKGDFLPYSVLGEMDGGEGGGASEAETRREGGGSLIKRRGINDTRVWISPTQ